MEKIYLVYNQWQMDSETWMIAMERAFTDKAKAEKHRSRLEAESIDDNDNFMIEEIELED